MICPAHEIADRSVCCGSWCDWNPCSLTFGVSDKGVISSHSALRASRTGLQGKPPASFLVCGSHRLRLGDALLHSPKNPPSNDLLVCGNLGHSGGCHHNPIVETGQ